MDGITRVRCLLPETGPVNAKVQDTLPKDRPTDIVEPGTRPLDSAPLAFLCDRMLARLCRRLRAAGYDTALAESDEHDGALLQRAIEEDRLLLTCDRKMAERRLAAGRVIVLPSNGLEGTALALMKAVPIDWLHDPFSRCLIDNTLLRPASPAAYRRLPARVRSVERRSVFICPRCGRIYWPGSHVKRMRSALAAWQSRRARRRSGADSVSGYQEGDETERR